jgi:uncharacterized protein
MKRAKIFPPTTDKLDRLKTILAGMENVLIAYSGGVDSTLLLKVASDILGKNVLAVIAGSETYPEKEIREAKKTAAALKARYRVIRTRELENPDFLKNPPLRCYYCKQELFSRLKEIARAEGIPYVLDGSNYDDRGDFRPGAKAGKELGIRSPLREARLTKNEIRLLSRRFRLPTWDKPSLACLASRFPYQTRIEKKSLRQIGQAEDFLRDLGFGQLRVRHHGQIARIEVLPGEFSRILRETDRQKIVRRLKRLGYAYVALDLAGYRTGSLNEPLKKNRKSESIR